MSLSKSNSFLQEEAFNMSLPKEIYNYFYTIAKQDDETVNEFIQKLLCRQLPNSLKDVIGEEAYRKVLFKVASSKKFLEDDCAPITNGEHLAKYLFSEPYNTKEKDNFLCTVDFKKTFLTELNKDLEKILSTISNDDCKFNNKFDLFLINTDEYKNKLVFKFNNRFHSYNDTYKSENVEVIAKLNTKKLLNKVFNENYEHVNFNSLLPLLCLYIDMVCDILEDYVCNTTTEIITPLSKSYLFDCLRFIRRLHTKIPFIGKGDCGLNKLSISEVKSVIRKCLNCYISECYIFIYNAYPLDKELLDKLLNPFKEIMEAFDCRGEDKELFNSHERLTDDTVYLKTFMDFRTGDIVVEPPIYWRFGDFSTEDYFNLNTLTIVKCCDSFVTIGYVSGETFVKNIIDKYSSDLAKAVDTVILCYISSLRGRLKADGSSINEAILSAFLDGVDYTRDIPSYINKHYSSDFCDVIKMIREIRKSIEKSERIDIKRYLILVSKSMWSSFYYEFDELFKDSIFYIVYNKYIKK